MYQDYDEKIKPEIIILSDLKNNNNTKYEEYYSSWVIQRQKEKENPNKSKEVINAEIKEEIKNNMNILKKESMKYYQIDNTKNEELEEIFNQIKLKINFTSKPRILRNGKFYTISQGCFTMYDNKLYNKSLEIKFEEKTNIISAIELDNKDLVFFAENQLIIYRLKNKKYSLFQKIDENRAGYKRQMSFSGCMAYPKTYEALFIKEISGNRFICVSNYGFKIYALNEKMEYSIILLEPYHESIRKIYELDKDNFIFCSQIDCGASLGGPEHNILILDKIKLKEITKQEKEGRLKEINNSDDYDDFCYYYKEEKQEKKITKGDNKNIINSLKYNCEYNEFFEYSEYDEHHYFRGEIILKNKYFLVGIDNNILLFDIFSGKQLKRYTILAEGIDNLYKKDVNINKWKNNNDNEFLINIKGNILLFRLTDENDLRIIANSYFNYIINLKKLEENNNKFYDNGDDKNYSISIFC